MFMPFMDEKLPEYDRMSQLVSTQLVKVRLTLRWLEKSLQ